MQMARWQPECSFEAARASLDGMRRRRQANRAAGPAATVLLAVLAPAAMWCLPLHPARGGRTDNPIPSTHPSVAPRLSPQTRTADSVVLQQVLSLDLKNVPLDSALQEVARLAKIKLIY